MTVYVLGAIGIGLVWLLGAMCGAVFVGLRAEAFAADEFDRGFEQCAAVSCGHCGWVPEAVVVRV